MSDEEKSCITLTQGLILQEEWPHHYHLGRLSIRRSPWLRQVVKYITFFKQLFLTGGAIWNQKLAEVPNHQGPVVPIQTNFLEFFC